MLAFTILQTSTLATKFIRTSSSPFIYLSGYNSGTITELEKKCKRLQTQVFQMEVQSSQLNKFITCIKMNYLPLIVSNKTSNLFKMTLNRMYML